MNKILASTCVITCFLFYVSCDNFFPIVARDLTLKPFFFFFFVRNCVAEFSHLFCNSLALSFKSAVFHGKSKLSIIFIPEIFKILQLSRKFHRLEFQCLSVSTIKLYIKN